MGEKETLVRDLNGEYERLSGVLASLSDADKMRPMLDAWSVKDILAHISGWLREGTAALERLARGERATPESFDDDVDARNARFVEQRRDASVQEMEAEFHLAKEAFVAAMGALPEERFAEGRTARRIVYEEGLDHFKEHAQQILDWKAREKAGGAASGGAGG